MSDLKYARVLIWVGVLVLASTPAWREVELRVFDWLATLAPAEVDTPIVVVGIDEPSFADIHAQWPWPRAFHARLIDRLQADGAAVIAFDVVFSEPSSRPNDDVALAAAIHRAGNVVLAAEDAMVETAQVVQRMRVEPLRALVEAGAAIGLAGLPLDRDGVVRRLRSSPEAFWRVVLDRYTSRSNATVELPPADGRSFMRVGRTMRVPYVSYYQALDRRALPPTTFRDRIVLIGLNLKTSVDPRATRPDTFRTPAFVWTATAAAGVEIQAAAIATVLSRRVIREAPFAVTLGLIAVVGAFAVVLMRAWQPTTGAVRAGLATATLVVVTTSAFAWGRLWMPTVAPVVGLALTYVVEGGVAFLREQALRSRLRRAFGHYVSPAIVEQLIAQPERLRLGGERKRLTILFCDLAGFTTLSETMEPEEVVSFLNEYLTGVAEAVSAHGGTVDKFLGDGLLAFWNAPVDDPDHALNACRAADAMQASVAALRARLASSGRPPVGMRVGIHTGDVIVGNMGSTTRFDYTASGDSVNLASRIEGVNKVFGTGILLSETTARELGDRYPIRPVDRVRVKGKKVPVELFTPCRDDNVTSLTTKAILAYRARDWDRSEALWKDLDRLTTDDRLPQVYLERIAEFRVSPPTDDWDGGATLNEK